MADESRTVIIDIEVEDNSIDKKIGDVNTQLKENRQQIKELNKDYRNNAKEIAALERENKDLSASKRELIKDSAAEAGSLNDLRRQLVAQVKERNNLNKTTVEGSKRFDELQLSIAGLNEEISGFEEAGGDFRRNVGNYPELLGQAAGGIRIFGTSLSDVFNLIKANPVILLVSALAGLVKIFSESQAGAEFFRKTAAALNTGLGLLKDIVENTGVALIEAFSRPQETLDELVSNIKEGIVYYFSEFIPNAISKVIEGFGLLGKAAGLVFKGEFSEALDVGTEAVTLLADGITDLNPVTAIAKTAFEAAVPAIKSFVEEVNVATQAAFGLEERLIANEKALADLRVSQAQSIRSQKELNLTVEDTTKSFEERIAAAEQFAQVEAEQIAESIRLQKERIEILKEQNELTNSTEEDIQRVRDAEIELANLQAASFEREVTNNNKLNTIRTQQFNEEQARIEALADAEKKAEEQAVKDAKIAAAAKKQFQDDVLNSTIAVFGESSTVGKIASSIQAGINVSEGITKALGAAPPPFNFALAALTAAAGAIQIAKINSTQTGSSAITSGASSSGASVSSTGSGSSGLAAVNASLLSQFSTNPQTAANNAENAATATANNLPPIQVSVKEINDVNDGLNTKVTEATLG